MHDIFPCLEDVGPTGMQAQEPSYRAELRAVRVTLNWFRVGSNMDLELWKLKQHAKLAIATDSTYVMDGATKWAKTWEVNGWRLSNRQLAKNREL